MNKQRLEAHEFRETESWVTHTLGERATRERNELRNALHFYRWRGRQVRSTGDLLTSEVRGRR